MLHLPDVTLVIIDAVAPALARLAIEDTLKLITPARVLVFTDDTQVLPYTRFCNTECQWIYARPKSLLDVANILWYEVPEHVNTSHILNIQWDGWAVNADAWNDNFLAFDYVGAVWPWHSSNRVGNGGFSLRSAKLMHFLSKNAAFYPTTEREDDTLSRDYHKELSEHGFTWAPDELAQQFSVEHLHGTDTPFGFHDIRNWPRFLSEEQIRYRLKFANSYVSGKLGFRDLAKAYL